MRKITRALGVLLSLVLAAGMFASAPAAVNAAEGGCAAAAPKMEANSSVGALLKDAAEQNARTDGSSECITDVKIDGKAAEVTLMHTKACTVAVGVYDETGETLLQTAVKRDISADVETVALEFENELPEFFCLRAFILDENCAPLGNQFETDRFTKAYSEFLEKTTADFPGESVVNFDDSTGNNFAVFNKAVKKIAADGGNIAHSGDRYTFTNAGDTLLSLKSGDVFTFENGGVPEVVKVGKLTVSGDTVTVEPSHAEIEEVFDYVKIDVTADKAEADMSEADEGVVLADGDSSVGALDGEYDFYRSFTFDLTKAMKQGGVEISGAKAELDMTAKMHFRLYYCDNVLETELTDEVNGELDMELGVTADFTIGLPKLIFPTPVAGLSIAVKPAFEAEISSAFHGKVDFEEKLGFKYNSKNGFTNLSQPPKLDAEVNFEGKIYVGLKLTPSVQAALGVVELGVELSVGAEGVGTRVLTSTDLKESDHRCRWCIDGAVNGKVTVEAEIATGLIKAFEYSLSAKLLDWEKELFDFYCSSDLGFGKGACPNREQPVPPDAPHEYEQMKLDYKEEAYTANYVLSGDRMHITAYITGSGNVMTSDMFGVRKFVEDYNNKVSEKADQLYPYDWDRRWEYFGAHCTRFGDVNSALTMYISGFNAVAADGYNYKAPFDVHISGDVKAVSINECTTLHLPDSVEELYVGSIKDFSSFRFPKNVKYIGGFYCCDITELTIPSSAEYVDGFLDCPIKKLTIQPPQTHLTLNGFWHCPIEDMVIPPGVRFADFHPADRTMKRVEVQSDSEGLLRFCESAEEVRFAAPLTSVGTECCNNCNNLKKVSFAPTVTNIGNTAFSYSGLERVTIPGTVKRIGAGAFFCCENLREIVIEEGVKQIDSHAFYGCKNLRRVVLPGSLSYLRADVFEGCENIELDFCGEPWQWWNITTGYRLVNGQYSPWKILDLEYDASIFMNCVIYLNSDGTAAQSVGKPDGRPVGYSADGLFAYARYLIAVEDEENGMLGGSITALAQVTADKYGRAEIPCHIAADEGQHLNLYGACSHRSAHLTEDKLFLCDVCGKRLPAVLDLSEPKPEPEALTGDVNGDGKVNGADAGILNRYTSGWTGYADRISDMKAADINGDGKVNGADSGILNRHTSGWTGYDKYFN